MKALTPSVVAAAMAACLISLAPRASAEPAPDGVPPIVWAAYNDDAAAVQAQLDAGVSADTATTSEDALPRLPCADPDRHGKESRSTALLWAAANGDVPLIRLLLAHHATWGLRDSQGWGPLHAAACNGHADAVAALLADPKAAVDFPTGHAPNPNETHDLHEHHFGRTALHLAARTDEARFDQFRPVALALLNAGANPDAPDADGLTPLHYAAEKCNASFVNLLLNGPRPATADVRAQDGTSVQYLTSPKKGNCANAGAIQALLYPSSHAAAAKLAGVDTAKLLSQLNSWRQEDPGALAGGQGPVPGALPGNGASAAQAAPSAPGSAAASRPSRVSDLDGAAPPPPTSGNAAVDLLEQKASDTSLPRGQRLAALQVLSQQHDYRLIGYFTTLLGDPVTRDQAAAGMGEALGKLKADHPGNDWSAFNAYAGKVIGPLGELPEGSAANGWYRTLLKDNFKLLSADDGTQKDFLKGFSDVDLLLMLGYNFGDEQVNEDHGMHSSAANAVWSALQERLKQNGHTLQALLDDPKVTALPQTRVRVITQLYKYDFIQGATSSDASLAESMPARLFPADYKNGAMGTFEAYGIGDQIMSNKAEAAGFARNLLQGVEAGTVDAKKGLLFLAFHKNALAGADAQTFDRLWKKDVPGWLSDRFQKGESDAQNAPPVYADWPAGKLNVLLVMSQGNWADAFANYLKSPTMKKAGWLASGSLSARPDASGVRAGSIDLRTKSGKPVHLDIRVYASDKDGWVKDQTTRDALTGDLIAGLGSPGYQAVFYRGHVGDYDLPKLRSKTTDVHNKAFGDLGCYSDVESERAVASCKTCAYFGTTVVSKGDRTDQFLPDLLDALARRETYAEMEKSLKSDNAHQGDKFTGSYDPADRFAADLIR